MLILGTTPQDKGRQLETLTLRILRHLNFEDCTANVLTGGAEVDARGRLRLPNIGQVSFRTLICECKAQNTTVDMTQWCKFLGKVFYAEACEGQEVAGCFIALSGVNGHVQGNYDELIRHRTIVSLVHGDTLLHIAGEVFDLSSVDDISAHVQRLTHRTAIQYEVAYHEGALYWAVGFSGGQYTLLSQSGEYVEGQLATQLAGMVEKETEWTTFVDLFAERQSQIRSAQSRALVIATVFYQDGVFRDGIGGLPAIEDYEAPELVQAARQLITDNLLEERSGGALAIPIQEINGYQFIPPELFRILFATRLPTFVLGCPFYDSHINEAILDHIAGLQNGLALNNEERQRAIRLLQLTPTGLATLLHPLDMLVNSDSEGTGLDFVERFRTDHFFQVLLESLKSDYQQKRLAEYFYVVRGLRELETGTTLRLKSGRSVEIEQQLLERIAIGPAEKSLGGGYVHVAILRGFPEPWEEGGLGRQP